MCTVKKLVSYAILFDVKKLKFLLTEHVPNWGGNLEKEMAAHGEIPWAEEPGRSSWGCKELDTTEAT